MQIGAGDLVIIELSINLSWLWCKMTSTSLSKVIYSAREEFGEGFVHILISWLKASRFLLPVDHDLPSDVLSKLEMRSFVRIERINFSEIASLLHKDDVVFIGAESNINPFTAAKLISFGVSDGIVDGVLKRPLDSTCLQYFDRVLASYSESLNVALEPTKYLFLDRDGVIIDYVSYPKHPSQVRLKEGIAEVIKEYRKRNHRIIMVTNQSGIARGYSTQEDFRQVQNRTLELLAQQGQWIDACYFATYLANSDVIQTLQYPSLRKPRTGMLAEESQFWNIDLENSVMIGDNASDVEWAQNAGLGRVFWLDNPELREKSPANMTNVTQVQSLDQILKLI
jgi:D-glycero-D-manno-heptose 1,7-bisphosphate phosphatase